MTNSIILTDDQIAQISCQRNSLTSVVYEWFINKFISGEFVPGMVLNRRQIAQELNISVAPVLEACVQLEQEGFIETIPRKGTLVKAVKENDAFAQLLIREGFEVNAVKIYHGIILRKHYSEFSDFALYMDSLSDEQKENLSFEREELRFHASLVNLCEMPIFTREFIRTIKVGVFTNINRIGGYVYAKQSHKDLLDSLVSGNKMEAIQAIRSHIWSGKPHLKMAEKYLDDLDDIYL